MFPGSFPRGVLMSAAAAGLRSYSPPHVRGDISRMAVRTRRQSPRPSLGVVRGAADRASPSPSLVRSDVSPRPYARGANGLVRGDSSRSRSRAVARRFVRRCGVRRRSAWPDAPSSSPEDFVECRRSRPHPSARWTADGAPSSSRPAPRRHACADDLCASATFGTRPSARTAYPEPRDGFKLLGRHAHARRRAQRPSGRARYRCRAVATRAVRRRFGRPRTS